MHAMRKKATPPPATRRDPYLVALGERLRLLRARRGFTRKALAAEAEVSERHLANLETGVGNASILVLRQIAQALGCPLAELLGDETTGSAEWLMIRTLLQGRDPGALERARAALSELFAATPGAAARARRIALIGLRGAGKSSLGQMLADDLCVPFVELNREVERLAGCSLVEVHSLYGPAAYRRYERRALEEVLQHHAEAVIATPGGVVSEPATFNLLLAQCFTVWLQAAPEEHMNRVIAQGDLRPMSGNREAMEDLKRILAGREPFYAKADLAYSTQGRTLAQSFAGLRAALRQALARPGAPATTRARARASARPGAD
jgi:XRE family aerobic/anaerobic benzoate catabolism transcriptional regulator